jgi:hypothetical protein
MSELKITGNITKILPIQKGTSKAGKEWQKLNFLVQTDEEYNNLYYFEIFGEEKINNFTKWNKVTSRVTIGFNVKTNEFNGKYYTSLVAWNIFNEFKDAPTDAEKERKSKNLLDDGVGKSPAFEQDGSYSSNSDDLPF